MKSWVCALFSLNKIHHASHQNDCGAARALKEREELMRELERVRAEAEAARYTADVADPHVSVVLTGVDYPERVRSAYLSLLPKFY